MKINYILNQLLLRSKAPIIQENSKQNLALHPFKLPKIVGLPGNERLHSFHHFCS